jgi:hypothetical protein
MSDTLLLSTRKGLFVLAHAGDGAWRIDATHFIGDNVSMALADPRDGSWYAALDLGHFGAKLQRSTDRGASWSECAVPAYAEGDMVNVGDGKPSQPATLKMVWALEPGGAGRPGRLWAGTIPGGLFRSDDHGASWELVRALWAHAEAGEWFGGGYDWPGIHSVCVDPRDPERAREPGIQDVHRMVQCRDAPDHFWVQHHNGVFRSTSGGGDWREIDSVRPSAFGFAVAVHPRDPDTAWFVPAVKDEKRYPVDGRLVVARTRDGGASFEVIDEGLPDVPSYDLVYRHGLAVDADGRRLAFGSTTGGLWTSMDGGDRWRMLPARLPPVHAVAFA